MKEKNYSSEGIVLARKNYGEADRILVLFSKERGRLTLMAKGIRRPKSKKRGNLEVFNYIKFQATRSRGIDMITEAEVINDFKIATSSLKKVTLAYYFVEVAGKITNVGESNLELFNLLIKSFKKLEITKSLKQLRMEFIQELLVLMGFWPEGKIIDDPDRAIEKVLERQIASLRVGKRVLE